MNNIDLGGFPNAGVPLLRDINDRIVNDSANMVGDLEDLRVAGQSRWKVTKSGNAQVSITNGVTTYAGLYSLFNQAGVTFRVTNGSTGSIQYMDGYGYLMTSSNGGTVYQRDGFQVGSSHSYKWTNNTSGSSGTVDLQLVRVAAGTLGIYDGANSQSVQVYQFRTDGSNYRRWEVKWNTTTAVVQVAGAGTGSRGSVAFGDAALATTATSGFVMIPTCAGAPTGVPADIPTGQAPMVVNSSGSALYIYIGGAWKTVALT